MADKCFCHLNGYKVKDADAHKKIEHFQSNLETMASAHEQFMQAIVTLRDRVTALESIDKDKLYYHTFTMGFAHADGGTFYGTFSLYSKVGEAFTLDSLTAYLRDNNFTAGNNAVGNDATYRDITGYVTGYGDVYKIRYNPSLEAIRITGSIGESDPWELTPTSILASKCKEVF